MLQTCVSSLIIKHALEIPQSKITGCVQQKKQLCTIKFFNMIDLHLDSLRN